MACSKSPSPDSSHYIFSLFTTSGARHTLEAATPHVSQLHVGTVPQASQLFLGVMIAHTSQLLHVGPVPQASQLYLGVMMPHTSQLHVAPCHTPSYPRGTMPHTVRSTWHHATHRQIHVAPCHTPSHPRGTMPHTGRSTWHHATCQSSACCRITTCMPLDARRENTAKVNAKIP